MNIVNRVLGAFGAFIPLEGAGLRPVATNRFALAMEKTEANGNKDLRLFSNQQQPHLVLSLELDGKMSAVWWENKAQKVERLARLARAEERAEKPSFGARTALTADLEDGWFNQPGSETAAVKLYQSMRKQALGHAHIGLGRKAALVSFGAFLVFAGAALLSSGSATSQASQAASAGSRPSTAQAGSLTLPPGVVANSAGAVAPKEQQKDGAVKGPDRTAMAALKGVLGLRDTGNNFYVFSDPNCSYCRELEPVLEASEAKFKPVIIPVAFQEGSREKAVAVLCSANPAAEWKKMMASGQAPKAKACAKGESLIDENMQMFRQLRLSATPTVVSPGQWVMINGAATPEELAKILQM